MDIYWFEQSEADVPPDFRWLTRGEAASLNALRFRKRYADWRLGRWTTKCALAAYLERDPTCWALSQIEVRPGASGAPEVFCAGRPAGVSISISHSGGFALCAIAPVGVPLGCDLETIEPRSDLFVSDYFTAEERALIASAPDGDRHCLIALLWSAKESALKALHLGLRADTRSVTVDEIGRRGSHQSWLPLRVRHASGQTFHGWWRRAGSLMRTVVADPPPALPRELRQRALVAYSTLAG